MLNVGVSEQQVFGMEGFGRGNAPADRPQFSGPAGGRPRRSDDAQPPIARRRIRCDSAGAVVAVVIDDHDGERPAIVLPQQ